MLNPEQRRHMHEQNTIRQMHGFSIDFLLREIKNRGLHEVESAKSFNIRYEKSGIAGYNASCTDASGNLIYLRVSYTWVLEHGFMVWDMNASPDLKIIFA